MGTDGAGAAMPGTLATAGNGCDIAVDGTSVYWPEDFAVMKMPLSGGAPAAIASGNIGGNIVPVSVALFGSDLYWLDFYGGVGRVPTGGGTLTQLVAPFVYTDAQLSDPTQTRHFRALAISATSLYFLELVGVPGVPDSAVIEVPRAGGVRTEFVSGQLNPWDLAINATDVYWTNSGTGQHDGSVMKMPLAGGTPTTIARNLDMPSSIALDSRNVYFAVSEIHGELMRVPLRGGTPTILAPWEGSAHDASDISDVVTDGVTVYWATDLGGTVMSVPVDGGVPGVVAAGVGRACGLAIDAESIYLRTFGEAPIQPISGGGSAGRPGVIMKLTPR